jgi:hypothetical protein
MMVQARRMTAACSRSLCLWTTLLLGIILLWSEGAQGQSADLTRLFPKTNEAPGWTLKVPPKRFAENQLFEYMDGAAEIPKSYTFRALASTKYQKGDTVLEVAVFDMGAAADAYGYYSARVFLERSPRSKERLIPLDHPAHLYAAAGVLTFWKDRYTIILQPDSGKPDDASLLRFARAVSAKIAAKGEPPALLRRLPAKNMIVNSARFVRGKAAFDSLLLFLTKDTFGIAKRGEAVAAEYTFPGGPCTLILIHYPDSAAAKAGYDAYRQLLTTQKAVFATGSGLPGAFVATASKEKGTGAVAVGSTLCVVTGAKDTRDVETGLRQLLAALKAK